MFKKILSILLALVLMAGACFSLVACGDTPEETESKENEDTASDFKVGFIFLHDENSTYDLNFLNGAKAACEALGLTEDQVIFKKNVSETEACYTAAAELVDEGCSVIFANSFGHEAYMIQAAQEFTDVQFCHATGTRAHTENLSNYHNAFASIYEGRYLAGIAAGLKLKEMIDAGQFTAEEAKIGYVGAFTYAEVISGYTSFYLGAKSVVPEVTMEVQFTGSWYDEPLEKEAANVLINNGCKLISQHADSMGAPKACEEAGIPNVSYNGSTVKACPNTFIISSAINWAPYMQYMIECVQNGVAIDTDWTGSIKTGSVVLTEINTQAAAAGTAEAIEAAKAAFEAGTLHVYDVSTFTVTVTDELNKNATVDADGHLTSYMADVDSDAAYAADTEVVKDGYFHESEYRSAPYFDLQIDGIKLLNAKY